MSGTFSNYPNEMSSFSLGSIEMIFMDIALQGIVVSEAVTIRCGSIERAKNALLKAMGHPEPEKYEISIAMYKGIPIVQDEAVLPGEMIVVDRWGKVWGRYAV